MSNIISRKIGQCLEIEFDRSDKMNALNLNMYEHMLNLIREAEVDDDIHVVVFSGKAFCFTAGNDLADFIDPDILTANSPIIQVLKAISNFKKPLVAAVNGPAIGIGTTMLLHCDLVYAGESAVFQMPFTNIGLVPEFAATYLLPKHVGYLKASEWLLLGQKFGAHEALNAGLVNAVFDDENYLTIALQRARDLAKLPQHAVVATKSLLRAQSSDAMARAMDQEIELFSAMLQTQDTQNAIKSIIAKNN